jgi:mRNA interferase HigB
MDTHCKMNGCPFNSAGVAPILGGIYNVSMRVIAKRTLREFYEQPSHRDAQGPLEAWHAEASRAVWRTPHEIKAQYASASIIDSSRVVFNIAGNKYRLLVDVDYARQALYVKFVGTHAQYDDLDLK